ncbi:MAG: uracil-DNA glycosylase, partial [Planctomycetes bacterium]|nr:uracil-DNA glycosylase [Planctomycetota bacterium]
MDKSALAQTIARQLQNRLELEGSLGAELQALTLPSPPAEPAKTPVAKAFSQQGRLLQGSAAPPAPASKAPARISPVPASALGQAAGIELPPISELPPVTDKEAAIAPLCAEALVCEKCHLCKGRTKVVFGEGSLDAQLVFVGEAPGANEDRTGKPFVGRAGELLTAMIERGMGIPRQSVYICNILKCR